jgi:ATP-dependent Clp protease ATP-binding subunit ClpC
MFERFTDRARRVLVLAQEEARLWRHTFIGTEHLLLGLALERDGVAARALASEGVTVEALRAQVREIVGLGTLSPVPAGSPPFTPRAKRVLELSLREAIALKHSYIGTEHLLLGLVSEGEGAGCRALVGLGTDPYRVREATIGLIGGDGGGDDDDGGGGGGRPSPQ